MDTWARIFSRDEKADKGVILHSRILWFFSETAMALKTEKERKAAEHAYRFLSEKAIDREYGGVYWSLTYDGKPSDTSKHAYCQAFAIYALLFADRIEVPGWDRVS